METKEETKAQVGEGEVVIEKKKRRFVGRKKRETTEEGGGVSTKVTTEIVEKKGCKGKVFRGVINQIPTSILENNELNQQISSSLPPNYNFEIHKIIYRLREAKSKICALQFPEGLLIYGAIIGDIIKKFVDTIEEVVIMGDVTYGACCVDDFTARALGADFLIHFGHSCLIPINITDKIKCLYVFVDIQIDLAHFVDTVRFNFPSGKKLVLVGTIQFAASMHAAGLELKTSHEIIIPQSKPLSSGELLGCTSPKLDFDFDHLIYLADGRFHLESILIHNPQIEMAYKYDPYGKKFTIEKYNHKMMREVRSDAVSRSSSAKRVGLILGTLGRQGSLNVFNHLESLLKRRNIDYIILLLSEIFPSKLQLFPDIDAWVQVACPRLSIDWGYAFEKPLLSPYEAEIAFGDEKWQENYPMDYYSKDGGAWSVYYKHSDK